MYATLTRHATAIALWLLAGFFGIQIYLADADGLIFDETAHIGAGYTYVTQGDYRLNPEHPPVLKVLAGLALLPLHPTLDTAAAWWTTADGNGEYGQWAAGRALLHESGNPVDLLTFAARVPLAAVATLFGALLFAWGRRLAGGVAGLIALTLYVLSPSVLGHSHYVTTDIGMAAAFALALAALLHYAGAPSWRTALLAGAAFGLAQVVKFSAILLAPFFVAVFVFYPLLDPTVRNGRLAATGRSLLRGLGAAVVALAIIWIVYAPFTVRMPHDVLATIAPVKFAADDARNAFFRTATLTANNHALTRPVATYLQGLGQVFNRVDGGNGAYFFGTVSSKGFPAYFPMVFVIKETIPHMMLLMVAAAAAVAGAVRARRSGLRFRQAVASHLTEIVLLGFIAFYAYISVTGNLTIGYRHLFPIVPLLYLLAAVVITRSIKRARAGGDCTACGRRLGIATVSLFALAAIDVAAAFPHYMSYFNQSVGGPTGGYRFVTDSNADWGQDSKRLATWLAAHPEVDPVRVDYFGGDDVARRLGDQMIPWWDSKRPVENGWYAVSVNYLQGSIHSTEKTADDSYRFLVGRTPYAQVGTSILVYYIGDVAASPTE